VSRAANEAERVENLVTGSGAVRGTFEKRGAGAERGVGDRGTGMER
jgi:hypothetical protein